jgi:hypothetical protein
MQEITWPLPLNKASQSKDVWKSGAATSPIWELVGVDGTNQGAIVPYPGFKQAWIFRYDQIPDGEDWYDDTNPYTAFAYRAEVLDFWTFTARIGSDYYCYGVVYLAQRPKVTTRDLILEGYRTDTNTYFYKVLVDGDTGDAPKLGTTLTNYAISVTSTPRVVYVFIRGLNPKAVTFPTGSVVVVDAGPGVKPTGSWVSALVTAVYTPSVALLPNPAASPYIVGSFIVYSETASHTGAAGWNDNATRWGTAAAQKSGDYAFAVQFEDSLSGRRSQLSDSVAVTFSTTSTSLKLTVVGIVDTTKYDTVKIWRSVRNTNAAGVFTAGILQLEATFLASEYAITPTSPAASEWSPPANLAGTVVKWAYAVQKDDRQLVMQDTFQDRPSFLSAVPFGGASAAYQSQLFVSNTAGQVSNKEDQMKSVGEIRYSSASDGSYELFAPKGRWTPDIFGDSPIAFQQCGQILLGFSANQVYFIMREGAFVRVMGAHNGYGITSPYALSNVGPMVYYVTHQGLRVVYADGRLDEVGAVDWLLSIDWADDLDRISMAFDPRTTALYIHNPVKNKTAVMWFSSGTCSELHNMPFLKCTRGLFAKTPSSPLTDTALFLLSETGITVDAANTAYRARLMVPAESPLDRMLVPNVLNTFEGKHYGLIDGNCDRCVVASIVQDVGDSYSFTWSARTYGWTPDYTIIGAYIKIVGDPTSRITTKQSTDYFQYTFRITSLMVSLPGYARVIAELVQDEVTQTSESPFYADSPTVLVAINPVVVKVQTAILPGGMDAGMFMNSKQVSSVGALISGYEYSGAVDSTIGYNQFSRWFANLYRGEEDTALLKGYSYNPSTDDTKKTIVNGTSPIHAAWNQTKTTGTASSMALGPQWSIEFAAFVVGQTFRLLALSIKGRILDTERNTNNYA